LLAAGWLELLSNANQCVQCFFALFATVDGDKDFGGVGTLCKLMTQWDALEKRQ